MRSLLLTTFTRKRLTWLKLALKCLVLEIIKGAAEEAAEHDVFGALLQYPTSTGEVKDISDIIAAVQDEKRHCGSSR